jgi:hypothetical protein
MTYSVTLEHGSDGSYLAWVHELPGCFVRGATREEIEAKLPAEIERFCAWAGETPGGFEVVGEVESVIDSSEDTEVLLDVDREPLTRAEWERIERWLERSRQALLEATGDVDVSHIGFVELMYAAWTFDVDSKEFLDWTRSVALARMRELARTDDGTVTEARWSGAPRPEPWTARKAARRLIWHESLHT